MLVEGYHGTTKEAADSICLMEGKLSNKTHLWLGKGMYFFQDAPGLAWWWADRLVAHRKQKLKRDFEPAVVRAEIDIQDCMDLLDVLWQEALQLMRIRIREQYRAASKREPQQNKFVPGTKGGPHRLDYEVINRVVAIYNERRDPPIRCVRGPFAQGNPIFSTSHIVSRAHVAIAIRDTSIIKRCSLLTQRPEVVAIERMEGLRNARS